MTKRLIILVASLALVVPFLFYGCGSTGDTGPAGAAGAPGAPGAPGAGGPAGPGVVANETCTLCHAPGKTYDVAAMHRIDASTGNMLKAGTATVTINSVTFGAPVGDNVPVTVDFNFAATNSAGTDITASIDLANATTPTSGALSGIPQLSFIRLAIAKLVAGATYPASGSREPNQWNGYVVTPGASGSGPYSSARAAGLSQIGPGHYSFSFQDNAVRASDGYADNVLHRVAVQFSIGNPSATNPAVLATTKLFTSDPLLQTSRQRPVANAVVDVVPPVGGGVGAAPGAGYPTKDVVTTAACNACHDPLGIHGGGRRDTKFCVVCHNGKGETAGNPAGGGFDNINLVNLVHGVHSSQNLGFPGNYTEVTYPQDILNCAKCHKGTDGDNWKNLPSIVGCGSCHENPPHNVNFATGANHLGGVQTNNQFCTLCHPASAITNYHATQNSTPNNPQLPGTLASFEYGINSVTVDNTNAATIKFWIKKDGAFLNLGDNTITRPAGFTGGPSFLFAYANNLTSPADYSNFGRSAGQPESLSIIGLPIVSHDNAFSEYTVKRANAFLAGAKMRAVALQGYFTQTSGGTGLDNVGRHTPSVMKAVTGDAVRRNLIKLGIKESGYDNVAGVLTPVGCLECHEIFEGHGGNRVNNVQVCVMCHNPSLTSSGRTIPDNVTINPEIVANHGSNPLTYPEVTNNFKELIHGLHSGSMRANPFIDIRNFRNGFYLRSDEITYPGNLMHCTKCHVNNAAYDAVLPNGVLFTTEKITTGVAGETRAQIIAARGTVPNTTDLVNSPIASACGYCHDTGVQVSHFLTQGADIKQQRSLAEQQPVPLMPDVLATP